MKRFPRSCVLTGLTKQIGNRAKLVSLVSDSSSEFAAELPYETKKTARDRKA